MKTEILYNNEDKTRRVKFMGFKDIIWQPYLSYHEKSLEILLYNNPERVGDDGGGVTTIFLNRPKKDSEDSFISFMVDGETQNYYFKYSKEMHGWVFTYNTYPLFLNPVFRVNDRLLYLKEKEDYKFFIDSERYDYLKEHLRARGFIK